MTTCCICPGSPPQDALIQGRQTITLRKLTPMAHEGTNILAKDQITHVDATVVRCMNWVLHVTQTRDYHVSVEDIPIPRYVGKQDNYVPGVIRDITGQIKIRNSWEIASLISCTYLFTLYSTSTWYIDPISSHIYALTFLPVPPCSFMPPYCVRGFDPLPRVSL